MKIREKDFNQYFKNCKNLLQKSKAPRFGYLSDVQLAFLTITLHKLSKKVDNEIITIYNWDNLK